MSNPAYNISLSIFRSREWVQQFTLMNIDATQDNLALVVCPVLSSGNAAPTIFNDTPTVSSSSGSSTIVFVFEDSDTESLTANANFQWQFLRQAAGNTEGSDVVCSGPLIINDSPTAPWNSS